MPLDGDLPVLPMVPLVEEHRTAAGTRPVLAVAGAVAVAVLVLVVLALPGAESSPDRLGEPDPVDRAVDAAPRGVAQDGTNALQPAASATPDAAEVGPVGARAPVDPALLPATEASHLVVTAGGVVEFIDLTTGERRATSIGGVDVFDSVFPVRGGVVVTKSGIDRPVYVPLDGEPVDLTDPESTYRIWPIGAVADVVYVQGEIRIDGRWHTTIGAVTLDGVRLWEQVHTYGLGAVGVTDSGDVISNAGGRFFTSTAGGTTELGVGVVHAVIGDLAIVDECDSDLDCGLHAFDLTDDSRTIISTERGFLEHRGGSPSFILWTQNDGPEVFSVADGSVVAIDVEPNRSNGELGLAVDEAGVVAVANYRAVTLTDQSGSEVEIDIDRVSCCRSRVAIAFLDIGEP